jgi:uncharacterized membrane protein YhaH (DUF805 family)
MNWFIAALKNYAVFDGRSRRKEFWYFYLFFILTILVLDIIGRLLFGSDMLFYVSELALIVPYFAVAIRRMHDVNKSGWFCLIPIYNLILFCTPGTTGPNDYGSDPKRPEFDEFLKDADPVQPA